MGSKETIEVDTRKLREVAIKNNENSISKLTDAIDKISGVKIPDDFEYKTELELLPNRIAGLQDTISDINRYIDKKAGEYEKIQGSGITGLDMRPDYMKLGMQNGVNSNTSPLNWSPSYQGGVTPNGGYGGYGSGALGLKDFLENLKKTGSKAVDFFTSLLPTKVYADETYNGRTYNVEQVVDLEDYLKSNGCDSLQGGCYDGNYIVLSTKKKGSKGGYVIWIDPDSKDIANTMEIGPEGGDMEGITCDRKQNFILLRNYNQDRTLIRINSNNKEKMENVGIPSYFRQHAYSKDTDELIGFNMDPSETCSFMKYDKKNDEYVIDDRGIVQLSNANFINIQGISCDSKKIYLSDSLPYIDPSNYKVWAYDFDGNLVEKHTMGTGYKKNETEVENTFIDDNGDTYLVMPFEVVKVND